VAIRKSQEHLALTAMSSDVVALSIGAAVLAVGFHISIIPQEIDFQLKRLFVLYVSVISCLFYLLHRLNTPNAALKTVFAASIFNVSLALSIFVHRAFLHRTRSFPGPFWAKVSKFYAVYLTLKKLQHHKEVEKLHKKFGDYVRTGPREISIIQPAAVQAIYGTQSLCTKAGFYSQATDHPNGSLNSTRVKVGCFYLAR
jgi:hypothetical protein